MNKPSISLATLLERVESEIETANGRTVRLCRDPNGNYWVVDGAERVMSLQRHSPRECNVAAREFCAQATRGDVPPVRGQCEGSVRAHREGSAEPGAKTAHA